jgi:acetyl-CoA synthetase
MKGQPTECEPESMDSEDDLFVIFTSGVTGTAKGIVHSQAGYLLHVAVTHKVAVYC